MHAGSAAAQSGLRSSTKRSIAAVTVRLTPASTFACRRPPSGHDRVEAFGDLPLGRQRCLARRFDARCRRDRRGAAACRGDQPPPGSGTLYSSCQCAVRLPITSARPGTRPSRRIAEGLSPRSTARSRPRSARAVRGRDCHVTSPFLRKICGKRRGFAALPFACSCPVIAMYVGEMSACLQGLGTRQTRRRQPGNKADSCTAARSWASSARRFLVDRDGTVARVWRNVRVPGHVEEVLAAARAL